MGSILPSRVAVLPSRRKGGDGAQRRATASTVLPGRRLWRGVLDLSSLWPGPPMINGPGNVWVERAGRLTAHAAPDLDEAALLRAAIHIARPLGAGPGKLSHCRCPAR